MKNPEAKNRYGLSENQYEKELTETYKVIFIFKLLGIALIFVAVSLGYYNWEEFSSISFILTLLGAGIVWVSGKITHLLLASLVMSILLQGCLGTKPSQKPSCVGMPSQLPTGNIKKIEGQK